MKTNNFFATFAALSALPILTAAYGPYKLPGNLSDGVHEVDLRSENPSPIFIRSFTEQKRHVTNQNMTNQWLGGGAVARQTPNKKKWTFQLPDSTIHNCSWAEINRQDYQSARQQINPIIEEGGTIHPHRALIISLRGTVIYVCAGDAPLKLRIEEFNVIDEYHTAFCDDPDFNKSYVSWVVIKEWQRSYGRTNDGHEICGHKKTPDKLICPLKACHGQP
ncbi:hypothetical protein HYFRA_00009885 [Hymenoscyphus fraxineus]|uniref:Uncharacterized protein n=1 Tax=Hymenoscyphus fraxineus TaxID=746836 RepID=A0A9N9PX74_9HELO|nr:hypothetical protein HYFRA_00009885 [Hymenoscyphus fraxineus]